MVQSTVEPKTEDMSTGKEVGKGVVKSQAART